MDVFSPDAWVDDSALAWLEARRTASGVVPLPTGELAVIGHAAATQVLTQPRLFTSRFGTGPRHAEPVSASVNWADPPHSTRLRQALPFSMPSDVALLTRARALLRPLVARGEGDLVTQWAQPLALATFGEAFGLTDDDGELTELGALSRALPRAGDGEGFLRADAALRSWLSSRIGSARRDTFFSLGAGLDVVDRLYLLRLLAQTGHESTAMAIALSVELVLTGGLACPQSMGGVDELLRLTSPLIRFAREVTERTELGERVLDAGTRVCVFFPLVNRDPAVFAVPRRFDETRTPNPHLAFGAGPHHCLGAPLARAQVHAAMSALAEVGAPRVVAVERLRSSVTRGLMSLVVQWV